MLNHTCVVAAGIEVAAVLLTCQLLLQSNELLLQLAAMLLMSCNLHTR